MERHIFISLIGKPVLVEYDFHGELQIWSMENFSYDRKTDAISHNRLPLIMDVFIAGVSNPRYGKKSEATHG